MKRSRALGFIAMTAALAMSPAPAAADDLLKLTIGQRGNWDTAIAHLGTKAGIFKKHGIELEMIYTSGSGETLQPVIAGSVDLGLAVGTLGAIAAFAKGAPVRIVGAEATGAADYWYAKASAPFKTLRELTEKNTIAYSTNGSSTNSVVRAFIDEAMEVHARSCAGGRWRESTVTSNRGWMYSESLRPSSAMRSRVAVQQASTTCWPQSTSWPSTSKEVVLPPSSRERS